MFSQVKQCLKGHHLYSSLPEFPQKPLKYTTDHDDPHFIENRKTKLESFLLSLLAMPHISHLTCVSSFLGIMEYVKEYSLAFHSPSLGLSLVAPDRLNQNNPAIVGSIQRHELCPGVAVGDSVSRINGISVSHQTLNSKSLTITSSSIVLII